MFLFYDWVFSIRRVQVDGKLRVSIVTLFVEMTNQGSCLRPRTKSREPAVAHEHCHQYIFIECIFMDCQARMDCQERITCLYC